jgi:hypothetical protein
MVKSRLCQPRRDAEAANRGKKTLGNAYSLRQGRLVKTTVEKIGRGYQRLRFSRTYMYWKVIWVQMDGKTHPVLPLSIRMHVYKSS